MPIFTSPDGRYVFAMETAGEGDGNSVVYDSGVPVWDRFSHEARTGQTPPDAPGVPPGVPVPDAPDRPPRHPLAPRVIPVTQESDGAVAPRMYSYWSNAWVNGQTAHVFAGSVQTGGPNFFEVDLPSGVVSRPPLRQFPYRGETEGWSFDAEGWIYLIDGPRYRRVSPFTGEDRIVYDISSAYPGCDLWQPHSSPSGQTHSATVRRIVSDGPYQKIATVVYRQGRLESFPAQGTLDESALVGSGWVVIKEDIGGGDRNRIINLQTRETQFLEDHQRALGHSDCGETFMVGEADKPDPGGMGVWDLTQPLTPERFRLIFPTLNMGYVSVRAGRCLWSSDTYISLVDLQTGTVTPLIEHGGSSDYDGRVKANLSPCGRVAVYMSQGVIYLLVLP